MVKFIIQTSYERENLIALMDLKMFHDMTKNYNLNIHELNDIEIWYQ